MKTNFKINTSETKKELKDETKTKKLTTEEEFEELISKSGASGSFMIFRSNKKDHELGMEEL